MVILDKKNLQSTRKMFFRFLQEPHKLAILGVRSCGYTEAIPGYSEKQPAREIYQIFWLRSGHVTVNISGYHYQAGTGDIIIYHPGQNHDLTTVEGFSSGWLTFNGRMCSEIFATMQLLSGVYHNSAFPGDDFKLICASIESQNQQEYLTAETMAYGVVLKAAEYINREKIPDPIVDKTTALIIANATNPNFTLESVADKLNLHRSTLSRRFIEDKGISMQEYLINLRIQKARRLLYESDIQIAAVARACGYDDASYFTRIFKKYTGSSPKECR